ncbi:MAG TPA: gamma-glutamyl-gamma-aminobutyrate hydrolase family protein [Phycisphaerales bacterium]|nr:gamma-glutamyl-gamma-aminobutyrate hydrolase family protein [Phycisphaerales bacterium]
MTGKPGDGRSARGTTWRVADLPLVGITTDLCESPGGERAFAYTRYARAVAKAGGVPVLLPPVRAAASEHARRLSAFVFTGGDDPRLEPFGGTTHPLATPVHADRQEYETALLDALAQRHRNKPVLGICLGMQMMALHAGGALDQRMEETSPTIAEAHWDRTHGVSALESAPHQPLGAESLRVFGRHRQAVSDPGGMRVLARCPDGVTEAVWDPSRAFYIGVQWHPERTEQDAAGIGVFRRLVSACCG